jgi:hypothetical protein
VAVDDRAHDSDLPASRDGHDGDPGKQRRKRLPDSMRKDLGNDLITVVCSAGGSGLLISAATGADRNVFAWGCGVALVVLLICVMLWRYDFAARSGRWRVALFTVIAAAALSIPVTGLYQILNTPVYHPDVASVSGCQPAGTVGSQHPKHLPVDVSASVLLPRPVATCSVNSASGTLSVYLYPGSKTVVGQLGTGNRSWVVCWVPGPGAAAWYYTQGDFSGPSYPELHAWGIIGSSVRPSPRVRACPQAIRQAIPTTQG